MSDGKCDNPSLFDGFGGILLIQSMISERVSHTLEFEKIVREGIDKLLLQLETQDILPTYCDGFAGIGWLLLYLKEHKHIEFSDDEFLEDLDDVLAKAMIMFLDTNHIDTLHGAIGIGIYFVKRKKVQEVSLLIDNLMKKAVVEKDRICWRFLNLVDKTPYFDLGMAHGNASTLYFFVKCYQYGIEPARSLAAINGLQQFFMDNLQNPSEAGSYFAFKLTSNCPPSNQWVHSRLAWCYGDLPALFSLFTSSRIIGNTELENSTISMLKVVSLRKDFKKEGILDAGFCHGTSGVCYFFHKLYQATSLDEFKHAADVWFEKTVSCGMIPETESASGYKFALDGKGVVVDSSLLNGFAGVSALALSYLFPEFKNDWDECFFLS